jgi:MarR family transcriptional regulator, lower aerobic nicotinate degradation pathway regulator
MFSSTTYLLQKAAKHSLDESETAAASVGVTARQYLLLEIAASNGDLSQNEIAAGIGVDVTVLGKLLADLEDRELVQRTRAKDDRRRHELRITAAGSRLLAKAGKAIRAAEDQSLAALSPAQRRELHALLEQMTAPYRAGRTVRGDS